MDEHQIDEFESLIDVDMMALDRQSAQQVRLVWQYGKELAEAQRDLDYAMADLEVTDAELDDEIRKRPQAFGLKKVTEVGVKIAVKRAKDHKAAMDRVSDTRYKVNLLYSALRTLDHRRTSLSNGVRLQEQNYMAHPRRPSGNYNDRSRFRSIKKRKRKGAK